MSSYEHLIFELPSKGFGKGKVESKFTTRFGKHIKDGGGHFWKLSDMDTRKKPYDAIMTYKGLDAKIEFKQSNNKKTVSLFNMLLPHQVKGLTEIAANQGIALVIYYNTFHNKYRVKQFSGRDDLVLTVE